MIIGSKRRRAGNKQNYCSEKKHRKQRQNAFKYVSKKYPHIMVGEQFHNLSKQNLKCQTSNIK
jgi:hypothetical protein